MTPNYINPDFRDSKKYDSAAYMIHLIQSVTNLNGIVYPDGVLYPKTIKNAVKICQALTKLDPNTVTIRVGTIKMTNVTPDGRIVHLNEIGIGIWVHPSDPNNVNNVFEIIVSSTKIPVSGVFMNNYIAIPNNPSTPPGINLAKQMIRMQITFILENFIPKGDYNN